MQASGSPRKAKEEKVPKWHKERAKSGKDEVEVTVFVWTTMNVYTKNNLRNV